MRHLLKILVLIFLVSCSSEGPKKEKNENVTIYQKQHLKEAINSELKFNSTDISPCCCTSISKSLFPNTKNFELHSPLKFYNIDEFGFTISTEYYYSHGDSIVRAIIYEWDWPIYKKTIKEQFYLENKKSDKLYEKYISISSSLNEQIGSSSESEIYNKKYYRESNFWNVSEKGKAYLFILGNSNKEFYRLRLITYE